MKFQLKTLTPAQACLEKSDALLVLLPTANLSQAKQSKASKASWPLAQVLSSAEASGDFEDKSGKTLTLYGVTGVAARVAVVMSSGKGSAKDIRDALNAGMTALKGRSVKKLTICLGSETQSQFLPLVMQSVADATYVYTSTKGSATDDKSGRKLVQITIGVTDAAR
jgi:leucyl aminopeptidase